MSPAEPPEPRPAAPRSRWNFRGLLRPRMIGCHLLVLGAVLAVIYGPALFERPPYEQGRNRLEWVRTLVWAIEMFKREDWDHDGLADWPESFLEEPGFTSYLAQHTTRWESLPDFYYVLCREHSCARLQFGSCTACDWDGGVLAPAVLHSLASFQPPAWLELPVPEPCRCCDRCALKDPAEVARRILAAARYIRQTTSGQFHYLPSDAGWRLWAFESGLHRGTSFYADSSLVIRYRLDGVAGADSPRVWDSDQLSALDP